MKRSADLPGQAGLFSGSFALLVLFACLVALMPPGVCPCWLNPNLVEYHFHFKPEDAGSEHSHEYLSQMTQATGIDADLTPFIPSALILALAGLGTFRRQLISPQVISTSWSDRVLKPPPKGTTGLLLV